MGRKNFLLLILIGFLTLSTGTSDTESSTSTSVSVSTVTRKVTSKSVSRSYRTEISTVTEETPTAIQNEDTSDGSDDTNKFQKPKKKILASNLKNISEKVVLLNDRENLLKSVINATEGAEHIDGAKANSSDSAEDEIAEEINGKHMNETVLAEISTNATSNSNKKEGGGAAEGRSLEDRSSEENANVNPNGKTKTTTERTTNDHEFLPFDGSQKVLNNKLVNSEGFQQRGIYKITRPLPSVTLPTKKSTTISKDNSFKNSIRFENDYYGPTGQTEWVPIVPEKLPVRSSSISHQLEIRGKPIGSERSNKTTERNTIVFPSDNVQGPKETNVILVKDEVEKTTIRLKNSAEKPTRAPNSTESGRPTSTQQPIKHPIKFRGAVRYKSSQSNSTTDDKKSLNETILKKINVSSVTETPSNWTLATLGFLTRSTEKPEETTEISVVTVLTSRNHTVKTQNTANSDLVVPPENVRVNITKEQQQGFINIIPGTNSEGISQLATKHNKSTMGNDLPKIIKSWSVAKDGKDAQGKNETDVVIPGSVEMNRSNESTPVTETKTMSTMVNVATAEATTTKSILEIITPKITTENSVFEEVSSQTSVSYSGTEKMSEHPVTLMLDQLSSTEETVTETETPLPTTDVFTLPTTIVPGVFEEMYNEEVEMSQEVIKNSTASESLPTTVMNSVNVTTEATSAMKSTTSAVNITTVATLTSNEIANTTPIIEVIYSTTVQLPKPFENENKTMTMTTAKPTTTTMESKFTSAIPINVTWKKETPTIINKTTTAKTVTDTPPSSTVSTTTTTTTIRSQEPTEEGIYYKNYIPTTINPHDDITEENVPAYLRLTVQAASWEELCRLKEDLRESIIKMLGGKNVSAEAVHFLNLSDRNCLEKIEEAKRKPTNGTVFLPVNMFLMDRNGDFDKNLSEAFLTLWGRKGLDFELPIRKVDFVTPIVNLTELADSPLGGSVAAAIVISCVAGICVILLGILFVIMKRRQKRFNYGQRCTPVSLDAYSLDSVSIYNSVRRKGMRASKRSYGNAAFDDPEVPTHPMNFAGLANFSSDKEQLYEEFNIIPQVCPKVEELPPGAETKNRYANVIPLPETRVHLTVKDGDPLSDYINANYVRGLKGAEKLYIACQAPMESTIEDFWRMVWEQQCKVILMLTDLQENGIEKCADYLPPNEVTDNLRLFGDFQVTLKKRDVKEKYIISNLKLKNMEANLWREVTHLWYLGWPDQGVPSEANSLIAFLIEARSQMKIQNGATTSSPAVVHCSPGTGRTGTVIACDLCIRDYEQNRMVDIPKCVFNLRRDRAGSVQTKDQYAFIYQVLNLYATKLSGGGIESI